jgi:hypothetical protein
MPPLAKQLPDPAATGLLYEWILRASPDFPRAGVSYEYYEQTGLAQLPDFDALTPVATGTAGGFDLSLRQRDSDFAFRFSGYLDVPASGSFTFYTSSDDGSQLFIDGTLVVDNDFLHANQERSGVISLAAGYHAIVVTFFERGGQEVLNASWQGPGISKQLIPASSLYREIPTPVVNAPPVLADPGPQSHLVGENVSVALGASDPDPGALLWYEAAGLPEGLQLDSATGVISGYPTHASAGDHVVTLGVSDGPDVDSLEVTWHVPEPNALGSLAVGSVALIALARRRARRVRRSRWHSAAS